MDPNEQSKIEASARALEYVEDGMKLGLGTGSTAAHFVRLLAERANAEGLTLDCVPTSERTRELAESLGLKLSTLDAVGWLDMTFDGADEFDADLNLIKGAGGALLQEKIVATASDRMIVLADESKQVETLGTAPLPVEVVRFGWETTKAIIEDTLSETDTKGRDITLRMDGSQKFVTDEGHYILDLHLRRIPSPKVLGLLLNQVPGVVEHGMFLDVADVVVMGRLGQAPEIFELPQ